MEEERIEAKQEEVEAPENNPLPLVSKDFLLAGQPYALQDDNKKYDAAVLAQAPNGLTALYCGFPTVSAKTQVNTLVRFPIQYLPAKNDLVIGFIKIRTAENFVVDIGAPLDANLGGLEFDGATKRNKPNLKVGSSVFCRVAEYSKYTGGKLSCINKGYTSKKGNQLGELKDGVVFWLPQYQHHTIQSSLLQKLGKCAKFDVAFGKNGRIWLNSGNAENTILIMNMFKLAANLQNDGKITAMIGLLK